MSQSYAVASYGGASAATEQVTVTADVNVGTAIVVAAGSGPSGVTVSTVTDSQGNSYTQAVSDTTQIGAYIYVASVTTKLTSGVDWIKVTYSAAGTANQWIARAMTGVATSGIIDVAISANSASGNSPNITSGNLKAAQEWSVFFLANGANGGAPTGWAGNGSNVKMANNGLFVQGSTDGPLVVQQTVQNGSGSYYTFADQVTWNATPVAASASLSSQVKWTMLCVTLTFAPVYKMADTNSGSGSTTLTVPVTTGSRPGNPLTLAGLGSGSGSGNVTGVTDSTNGNTWTQLATDSTEGFHLSTWNPVGNGRVGATVFPPSYPNTGGSNLKAAQDYNGFVKRPIAFQSQKRYLNEQEWISSGSDKSIATDMAGGINKILLTVKPLRKNQTTYSGSDYTAELTALTNALNYFKSVIAANPGTQGGIILWQECSLNGGAGNFGDGTTFGKKFNPPPNPPGSGVQYVLTANSNTYFTLQQPTGGGCNIINVVVNGTSVGTTMGSYYVPGQSAQTVTVSWTGPAPTWYFQESPYAVGNPGSVSEAQASQNYANYVHAYASTIVASGLPLIYDPAISSHGPSIDYWNAISPADQALHSAITVDYYCSDYDSSQAGKPQAIDTVMAQLEAEADRLGIAFGVIEWGFNDGTFQPTTADFVAWANAKIIPIFQRRLAAGKPCADLVWYESGGGPNTINGSTDPAVIAIHQQVYDLFNATPAALSRNSSLTVTFGTTAGNHQAVLVGANTPLPSSTTPDQNVKADFASTTAPTVTTGALAGPTEVVFGIAANANAGGPLTWAGGWTPLSTNVTGSSTYLNVAYQLVSGTGTATASGTLGTAAATEIFAVSYPIPSFSTASLKLPAMKMSFTGTITGGGGSDTTGTFSLTLPSLKESFRGLSGSGTPYLIGNAAVSSGVTSLNVPVNLSVTSGDTIFVAIEPPAALVVPTVGPDTAGNAYSLVGHDTNGTIYVFESDGSSPLVQGIDSIPVSVGTAVAGWEAAAIGDNGVTGSDKVVFANGTGTAVSSGSTGTLSQKEEHAIAFVRDAGINTFAWTAPWTPLFSDTNQNLNIAYQVVNATTALTGSGTWPPGGNWAAGVITTEVTPNVVSLTPSNGIVGVPYSQTLEDTGGAGAKTWSITGAGLPPGLTVAGSTGVISGVPTSPGSYTYGLKVTDAQGATATLTVTTTILPAQPAGPSFTSMPTNLLTLDDSMFEPHPDGSPPAFTWDVAANANAPFALTTIGFIGSSSLAWSSAADGSTAIASAPITIAPGAPVTVSGMILPCGARDCQVGAIWYQVTSDPATDNPIFTPISATYGPVSSSSGSQWIPMSAAVTAPQGAGAYSPTVLVQESNAGDVNLIDMMFTTSDDSQVLIDWINGPFSSAGLAGSNFMDVTPWVRMDQNGITYFRGRQDSVAQVGAGSASFELENDYGEFAREKSTSLPVAMGGAVTLQRRVQVNFADENGVWYTRYDGPLSEIDYVVDITGNTAQANVMFTDILAKLNRDDPLFCWTKNQVLADGPAYHWTLDDAGTGSRVGGAGGAGVAAETSGNNGPSMRLLNSDTTAVGGTGAATIQWQDTSGGIETLADAASATGQDGSIYWNAGSNQASNPLRGLVSGNVGPFTTPLGSVSFVPFNLATSNPWPTGTQTAQNTFIGTLGYQLAAELPTPLSPNADTQNYTIECWFMPDVTLGQNLSAKYGPFVVLGLGSSTTKVNLLAGMHLNSPGNPNFKVQNYNQPPAFLGLNWPSASPPSPISSTSVAFTPDKNKSPHHLVISMQGASGGGLLTAWLDGQQIGAGFTLQAGQTFDTIAIGGAYGGAGAFYGNISSVSIYNYLLSQQQITQHAMLGQYGMWEQTTDDCIALLGQFANVPSFWSNLNATHSGLTMTDYFDVTNSNALAAMHQYEAAEDGLLYIDSGGALTFLERSLRQGYRAPDLYLPPGSFDPNMTYNLIDQFMINEAGISGPNTLGANAVTLLANPVTGQTQTQTQTSNFIQSGFINTESQANYGVYASSPVSSPTSMPLISWSRGYAALGLPQFSYWADPNLTDRAAWDANSHSEPWVLPASITVDLLTFEPPSSQTSNKPAGIPLPAGKSSFFALEIGNVIAPTPGSMPASFPDGQASLEWFIEGIGETKTTSSHTIQFYTSPAETQRAWIPGDSSYGILDQTTRIGISAADTGTIQAYGKSVAHDAGPPYWPPTFSKSMNDTTGSKKGFVGAADIRGLASNLQNMLQPPICMVSATNQTQSFTNGGLTGSTPPNTVAMFWDVIHVDTTGGMGAVPGWPNWYLVTVPGFYEIDAAVTWSITGTGLGGYTGQSWIIVAQAAAQAIAAGVGTPLTVNQYVAPVGEAVRFNANSMTPAASPATRMYLGVGDMVAVGCEQNYTSSRGTSTAGAGSSLSLIFSGMATNDDRTLINTALGVAGSVSLHSPGVVQQAAFLNTHTYSYAGKYGDGSNSDQRRNTDLQCFQGKELAGQYRGSQDAQIAFNVNNMISTLSGHTILSATLTCANLTTHYGTGARLMLGYTNVTPGQSSFNAPGTWTTTDILHQHFKPQEVVTFNIPISIVQAFVTGGAQALVAGDGVTTDLNFSGSWQGGPSQWTMVVNYI